LLAACKNPSDTGGHKRHYEPLPDLPPIGQCVTPEKMREDMAKAGFVPGAGDRRAGTDERDPVPFVPMTPERKNELLRSLKRTLESKYGESAGKLIADLPEHDSW